MQNHEGNLEVFVSERFALKEIESLFDKDNGALSFKASFTKSVKDLKGVAPRQRLQQGGAMGGRCCFCLVVQLYASEQAGARLAICKAYHETARISKAFLGRGPSNLHARRTQLCLAQSGHITEASFLPPFDATRAAALPLEPPSRRCHYQARRVAPS